MGTLGKDGEEIVNWVSDSQNLTMQAENKAGVLVAKTTGRIDGGNSGPFQEALQSLLEDGPTALVLDFEDLVYISSAGLRVILLLARRLGTKAGKVAVCSLTESVSEVFQISGFDKIVPVHAAQADALSAISG